MCCDTDHERTVICYFNTKTRRPPSGQKMVEWNELDVASFLEQVTGFLAEHGQLDGPSCNAPPAKRARSVRLSLKVLLLIRLLPRVCFSNALMADLG